MGTKKNPGQFDCHAAADDDEPLFTLRANDPLAPDLVREWAHRYELKTERALHERGEKIVGLHVAKSREARACAREMERWRLLHGT